MDTKKFNMTIKLKPKTAEIEALAAWLKDADNNPLEEIAREYNLDPAEFRELVSETYTRCANAAITYHSDKNGEYSQAGAAQQAGVDLWAYIYFKTKYGVYHDQSESGLKYAEKLKQSKLYDSSLL